MICPQFYRSLPFSLAFFYYLTAMMTSSNVQILAIGWREKKRMKDVEDTLVKTIYTAKQYNLFAIVFLPFMLLHLRAFLGVYAKKKKEFLSMDCDCWHFIRLCYCCCCCRIDHSQIWASFFFFFFFLSRLSYRLADIDDVFLCTIMTDHGEEEKKKEKRERHSERKTGGKREREKKKIWFAVLISYKENISTHSGCFFSFFLLFVV